MEDHQEFEKPVFESYQRKVRSSRTKKKNRWMNHRYEEIFCYYGLRRESPKRTTTQKPLRIKKRLVRCGECGKGFRYEKCLRNHIETMHSLEEKKKKKKQSDCVRRDLLCFFRSGGVQRRKRSKRVSRYKRSLPKLSVSSSSSVANNGELLEVAESLIMLSKSGDALFSNLEINQRGCDDEPKLVGKFADASLSNELKRVSISTESGGKSKELLAFLGDKKVMKGDESCQLKQVGAESLGEEVRLERVRLEDRAGVMLKKAETDTEAVFEASNAASEGLLMDNEHRCRLCERVFSTYQALGGHQTVHRMKNSSEKSKHEMQRKSQ